MSGLYAIFDLIYTLGAQVCQNSRICIDNSVNPDQLASSEDILSGSTLLTST